MEMINVKILSVYRTDEGIIVDRKNEFGTSFEKAFDTVEGMLEYLDTYKQTGKIDEYQLNISNEFWSTVINFINTGEIPSSHGGKREGAGRPSLGTTKKVSLTLPDEIWEKLEEYQRNSPIINKQSAVLRSLIERYFEPNRYGEEVALVPVETKLLREIQKLAVNSNEIYDTQDPEGFVHNILNSERLRLRNNQGSDL
jgi:hypothetical protein